MSKNIILLSDGTGNSAAKRNKTNVWKLYDALDLHRYNQVAFYDDGVGSQEFLPFKILGGAFGLGLKRNVLDLYRFLCRNYQPGDKIYLFGFSRGAYTVRLLIGMIDYCGVYADYKNEKDLEKTSRDNYRAFRSNFITGFSAAYRSTSVGQIKATKIQHQPEIEFIGVWDTVDAYGMPIDELAWVIDYFIYPIYFPDYELCDKVKRACHAISVDDERHTFHPLLWNEKNEPKGSDRIEQVWFPGVHSDVGGGYPKYTLSMIALDWMISRVEASADRIPDEGLYFIPQRRQEIFEHSDWNGPQHDSRALAGAYYRYKPRDIGFLCNNEKKKVFIDKPKIHRSVLERIAANVITYEPTGLPETYEVNVTRGSVPEFESPIQSKQRKADMMPVKAVIEERRLLYKGLLTTTLGVLVSPLFFAHDLAPHPLLEKLLGVFPDFATPWIKVFWEAPYLLIIVTVLFVFLGFRKSEAWDKTQSIANKAWSTLKSRNK